MNLSVGNFKIDLQHELITVTSGEAGVSFRPAEAEKALKAVSTAMGLATWNTLPPSIPCSPFKVFFDPDFCVLQRADADEGCKFSFEEGDDLIRAIQIAVDKVIDENRISGGPKAGVSSINQPEPVFEGRS